MRPGDTFFGFDLGNHMWMVLSEPDGSGQVAVANLTTHGRSATCRRGSCVVLEPAEHPYLRHQSCVYYRGAALTSGALLDDSRQRGMLDQQDPLSAQLLKRIQEGALASDLTALEVQEAIRTTLEERMRG